MTPSKPIQSYLGRYAEPEAQEMLHLGGNWDHVVAIPACSEDPSFEKTLESLRVAEGADRTLVIVVVNGAEDSEPHKHERNAAFLVWLRGRVGSGESPLSMGSFGELDVLVVDRASPERRLPARQGVGLARKISVDIPLALYAAGRLGSAWVHTTDADVEVPRDYLLKRPQESAAAGIHPYIHTLEGGDGQHRAMHLYEAYLHYYALGLRFAGSRYAYTAIGSTIMVHLEAYAAVRGFPKRQAGEDFYLLNKLAKVAPIQGVGGERIQVRGRLSDRVPFGTGAALDSIQSEEASGGDYAVYDPRSFGILRDFLEAWEAYAEVPDLDVFGSRVRGLDETTPGLLGVIDSMGIFEAAKAAAKHTQPGPSLSRRLTEWFDAFRTLKFMHGVRDSLYPPMRLLDALVAAPFCPVNSTLSVEEACGAVREEVEAHSVRSGERLGIEM
jgi:hypothetical protein